MVVRLVEIVRRYGKNRRLLAFDPRQMDRYGGI
jgi:hypothetical protein